MHIIPKYRLWVGQELTTYQPTINLTFYVLKSSYKIELDMKALPGAIVLHNSQYW